MRKQGIVESIETKHYCSIIVALWSRPTVMCPTPRTNQSSTYILTQAIETATPSSDHTTRTERQFGYFFKSILILWLHVTRK